MKKNNIFILAISIASLVLVSCDGGGISPDVKSLSSVTSVTLRSGSADVGANIAKTPTDAAFTLTANVAVLGGAPTTVTWTSSDTSVATVSTAGLVTIVAAGTTIIKATSTHDATKSDSVTLTVAVPTPSVTSVTLQYNGANLGATLAKQIGGAAFTLTADVVTTGGAPTTVTWTSSDTSVATVSTTGLVTMVATGTTTITATSTHDAAKADSVTLTVQTAPVPPSVTSVTLRNGNADAGANIAKETGDGSFTLTASVAVQGGASTTVNWTSSDTSVATVSTTGLVTIVARGTTTITATSTEDATKADSVTLTVTATIPPSVTSVTLRNGNADAGANIAKETGDGSFTLTASVAVQGGASTTVNWTSSDTSVATVSTTGLVTIVARGTTTITATSTEDATKADSVTLTVTVTIPPSVTSVTLMYNGADAGANMAIQTGDANFSLIADVVVEGGAATTVRWTSSDTSVATVSTAGLVTIVAGGTTTITATSTEDSTKTDSVTLTVTSSSSSVTINFKSNGDYKAYRVASIPTSYSQAVAGRLITSTSTNAFSHTSGRYVAYVNGNGNIFLGYSDRTKLHFNLFAENGNVLVLNPLALARNTFDYDLTGKFSATGTEAGKANYPVYVTGNYNNAGLMSREVLTKNQDPVDGYRFKSSDQFRKQSSLTPLYTVEFDKEVTSSTFIIVEKQGEKSRLAGIGLQFFLNGSNEGLWKVTSPAGASFRITFPRTFNKVFLGLQSEALDGRQFNYFNIALERTLSLNP